MKELLFVLVVIAAVLLVTMIQVLKWRWDFRQRSDVFEGEENDECSFESA